MKSISPLFIVLVVASLMFSLAMFLAGVLIFLTIQAFHQIYVNHGIWLAFIEVIVGVILFYYIIFMALREWFICALKKKTEKVGAKVSQLGLGAAGKFVSSFLAYEVMKAILKKIKK